MTHWSIESWSSDQSVSQLFPKSLLQCKEREAPGIDTIAVVSRIWCLFEAEDNVIVLAFSSSLRMPDDMEAHNNFMIEESGPLSASYQIHQCDHDSQKPLARCYISELELGPWKPYLACHYILYAVFSSRECFSFPRYSLTNYLQIYILDFALWLFSVEMILYITCCVYTGTQNIYYSCWMTYCIWWLVSGWSKNVRACDNC